MFLKRKSLFLASITILASIAIYNIYNSDVTFAASASISTSGTVSIDVSASGNSANIGTDTVTVNTTCSTGYTVSIASSIADASLYKDGDATSASKISPSSGTVSSPASILGSNLGTWGYSTTATSVNDNFIGLTNTPTIIKQSSVASATGGDQFPVYFGVSVPNTLEPGQYTMANSGTIVYQLTMPVICNTYTIKYDGNNNDAGTTMSVVNDNLNLNDTTTLMPSNYKRAGFGFAGWNTKADGTGENFGPMEDVTLSTTDTKGNALIGSADTNREITLYAKWIQSQGNLQGWTGCDSMTAGDVTALTDTRDNNTYAIAKLADGKCWMIENMRLGGSSAINLTSADTNITSNVTLPASTDTFTASDYTTIEMSATNTLSPIADITATPDNDTAVYSYGNYYSWPAAIGSTTAYSSGDATTSICPSGWHLPKGNSSVTAITSDFGILNTVINSGATNTSVGLRKYPNNYIYSGYLNNSSFYRSNYGYYWSSTVENNSYAYLLYLSSTNVYPGTYNVGKYHGFSVRCIADEQITIEKAYEKAGKTKQTVGGQSYYKMQDMNDSICGMANVLDEPGQTQLIDTRDNKIYWATKLQDGHCWMTQNLDLNLSTSTALTNQDTDLNTVTSWTPARSTINAVTNTSTPGSITGWTNDANTPYSVDTGDYYWKNTPFYNSPLCGQTVGSITYQNCNYVTKSTNDWKNYFSTTPYASNGTHGHVGNYYNFSAAVASNNTSSYTASTFANPANNPPNSICPKGWRLPTITSATPDYTVAGSKDEFSRLVYLYGNYTGNTSISSEDTEKAPLYYPRSGSVYSSILYRAGYNSYGWSSTVSTSTDAYYLGTHSGVVSPQDGYTNTRVYGLPVRCLAR